MSNKIIKQDVSKDKKTKKKVNSSGGLGKGGSNGSDNGNKIKGLIAGFRNLNKPAKVSIIVALVVVVLVGTVIGAYAAVRSHGKQSLLNADVIQEYDSNYVQPISWSIHQNVDMDDLYRQGGFADNDIIANTAGKRNFDVIYNHKKYSYNSGIINLLVLGIDDLDVVKEKEGLYNGGQSDAIYMLSLDTVNKKFWLVQVPRDAVALIDVYDENGVITDVIEAQITIQHGVGNGLEESNYRSAKAISRMFYGLPIHSTTSANMGGVIAVNDAIGGVTVQSLYTFTTNWNDYGTRETFVEGETYTLMGTSAYNYVHFRDITRMNTSSERLARQKQYLNNFFDSAWSTLAHNPTKIIDIYNTAMDYIITDLSTSEMVTLVSEAAECSFGGIYTLEGKVRDGQQAGESEHYDLDQDKLKEYLINNYYIEVEK